MAIPLRARDVLLISRRFDGVASAAGIVKGEKLPVRFVLDSSGASACRSVWMWCVFPIGASRLPADAGQLAGPGKISSWTISSACPNGISASSRSCRLAPGCREGSRRGAGGISWRCPMASSEMTGQTSSVNISPHMGGKGNFLDERKGFLLRMPNSRFRQRCNIAPIGTADRRKHRFPPKARDSGIKDECRSGAQQAGGVNDAVTEKEHEATRASR